MKSFGKISRKMVEYTTTILKFSEQGDKTGWTYIEVPADVARQLKPNNRKTFRVKGQLDIFSFSGAALLPMGEGNFILALNAEIRRGIRKSEGAVIHVRIEEDKDFSIEPPPELIECLHDDPESLEYFNSLAKSHRDYFANWINTAKTDTTRANRIVQTIKALENRWDYGQMIRAGRKTQSSG